jgi:hypothetical protein
VHVPVQQQNLHQHLRPTNLLGQPRHDPLDGVPLLARRVQVRPQPFVDRLLVPV